MRFCSNCQNMYYLQVEATESQSLILFCRQCGNKDSNLSNDDLTISKILIKKSEQSFHHIINKYTKFDPTLERRHDILCPNDSCNTNLKSQANERDVVYIRYDETNMKYVFLCCICDTIWNSIPNT